MMFHLHNGSIGQLPWLCQADGAVLPIIPGRHSKNDENQGGTRVDLADPLLEAVDRIIRSKNVWDDLEADLAAC